MKKISQLLLVACFGLFLATGCSDNKASNMVENADQAALEDYDNQIAEEENAASDDSGDADAGE